MVRVTRTCGVSSFTDSHLRALDECTKAWAFSRTEQSPSLDRISLDRISLSLDPAVLSVQFELHG